MGFANGWIRPEPPQTRTGKSVAVVGSGPAGLAAAQQLNRAGHRVTVFERDEAIGGLLRLGIPDFKLPAEIVQRRVDLMAEEGIDFRTNAHVGVSVQTTELRNRFDAIVLATGSTVPRDLPVPGRELDGVHFAMEYLPQQNRVNAGDVVRDQILATDKHVIILGGGDTGADCLGTAHRQGAASVTQFELLPEPPGARAEDNPWPQWSRVLHLSAAHEEGGARDYNISTTALTGGAGKVEKLHAVRVGWKPQAGGRPAMEPLPSSEFEVEAGLVLLAMGFLHPEQNTVVQDLGVALDGRGNVATDANKMTNQDGVFVAGDARRGQSLVVWAIAEGSRRRTRRRRPPHGRDQSALGAGLAAPSASGGPHCLEPATGALRDVLAVGADIEELPALGPRGGRLPLRRSSKCPARRHSAAIPRALRRTRLRDPDAGCRRSPGRPATSPGRPGRSGWHPRPARRGSRRSARPRRSFRSG